MVTYIPSFQPHPIGNGIVFLIGAIFMYILLLSHLIITYLDVRREKTAVTRQTSGMKRELRESWPICSYFKNCNPCTRDGTTGPTRQPRLIWYVKVNTILMMIFNAINLTIGSILMLNLNWDPQNHPAHRYSLISWLFKILLFAYDCGKFTLYSIFLMRIQV